MYIYIYIYIYRCKHRYEYIELSGLPQDRMQGCKKLPQAPPSEPTLTVQTESNNRKWQHHHKSQEMKNAAIKFDMDHATGSGKTLHIIALPELYYFDESK